MRETIDGIVFKEMVVNAARRIDKYKQSINELNVFPVPDGDTGTNMCLTINSAVTELNKAAASGISQAADIVAGAMLRGARGNSGVILSLLFRGMARGLKGLNEANAASLALSMSEGVTAAYKAVMKPSEGSILTVSRLAAAAACEAAESGADVEGLLVSSIAAGNEALADTVNQNPVLKKAGVIDAGGKGYIIILEAMLSALRGEFDAATLAEEAESREKAVFSEFDTGDITFAYCTEFIVTRENAKDPALLGEFLDKLGDSVVVVDDDELIKVHVHSNNPGVVLTEALTFGSLLTVKIENMREQHTETIEREAVKPRIAEAEKNIGVVAVCAGEGLHAVFADLGVDGSVTGGQTMNPSTEDILAKINATPAETVIVLPNNSNIIFAAEQCKGMTPKNVIVVPTATIPQGISAMLAFDPEADAADNASNMREAISNVHTISVTYAARDSVFDGIEIHGGDYLAMLENQILCSGSDAGDVFGTIIETVAGFQPEFVTVFYGSDVSEETARGYSDAISLAVPDAELTLVSGGQPVYYFIISAE